MGTKFLSARETDIAPGYQNEVIRAADGGQSTTRTKTYDTVRGTPGWPDHYNGRGVINKTWIDHESGLGIEENQRLYDDALRKGDSGWGLEGRLTTYAGTAVGLVRAIDSAEAIVTSVRGEIELAMTQARAMIGS